MRTLAIGDIHGCRRALETLADCVGFGEGDTVVGLGDYVDRGPDTNGVIDFLLGLENSGNLVALRGNHEIMMLNARRSIGARADWLGFGGVAVLDSYGAKLLDDIPRSHWDFLERTLRYHETPTHLFVHANLDPRLALAEQTDETLFWKRFNKPQPHSSGKIMICGHTAQHSGLPVNLGHAICIDTWVYGEGWLTCLDVDSGNYWQANERRERRRDHISTLLSKA